MRYRRQTDRRHISFCICFKWVASFCKEWNLQKKIKQNLQEKEIARNEICSETKFARSEICTSAGTISCLTMKFLRRFGLFDVSYIVRKRRLDLFRSRRQTSKWCTGKPDPPNLYQDEGRWPAFAGVETCQRSFAHHLDPPDLPWHRCYRVTATEALELAEDKPFWRTIATARRFGWSLRVWWWWWW